MALAAGKCTSCGAEMASDQRYCLECGERRGPSRFPVLDAAAQPASNGSRPAAQKRSRFSPSTTLLAGIATLLVAMGTGVLIGRSGDLSSSKDNSGVQVVTTPAGGGTTSTPATANTSTTSGGGTKSGGGAKSGGGDANAQASSGNGPTATQKAPPPTVQPGQSCSAGTAGCKGGKFTGDFFGP